MTESLAVKRKYDEMSHSSFMWTSSEDCTEVLCKCDAREKGVVFFFNASLQKSFFMPAKIG